MSPTADKETISCEGCGSTDPAALIFMTNASWTAVRCGPCAIYLLTSFDRMAVASREGREWPEGMEMIRQLREAVGLFAGAMPITPLRAWEQALSEVRRTSGSRLGSPILSLGVVE